MKDHSWKVVAVVVILCSVSGLAALPFLAAIVQYLDCVTGFLSGAGYLTNYRDYLFRAPLVYIGIVLWVFLILAAGYLIWSHQRDRKGKDLEERK